MHACTRCISAGGRQARAPCRSEAARTNRSLPLDGHRRDSPARRRRPAARPLRPHAANMRPVTAEHRERPIGVFDSGVGGLTVLHELLVALPHEDFVYLGDTARFPYGERSAEELERFSLEVAEELLERHVKLLVVACNSATAAALPALQRRVVGTTPRGGGPRGVQPGAGAAGGAAGKRGL